MLSRNLYRAAAKNLKPSTTLYNSSRVIRPAVLGATARFTGHRSTPTFSTMASLKSGAEVAAASKEYDPEIVDMAKYIHNYNIDSDVAVRSILSPILI